MDVVRAKRKPYMRRGKPAAILTRTHDSDFRIVARYQEEFRGLAEYYQLAYNRHRLGLLRWVMERSLTKTLGHKNKISVSKVWHRYRATWQTPAGPRRGLQVNVERDKGKRPLVARWGGVSLARRTTRVILKDDLPAHGGGVRQIHRPTQIRTMRICQAHTDLETHHVRRLKDLHTGNRADQPDWARQMATPSQDPDRLPRLPPRNPQRVTGRQASRNGHWRATCGENRMRRSEGGRRKGARTCGHLAAAYPAAAAVDEEGRRLAMPKTRRRMASPQAPVPAGPWTRVRRCRPSFTVGGRRSFPPVGDLFNFVYDPDTLAVAGVGSPATGERTPGIEA